MTRRSFPFAGAAAALLFDHAERVVDLGSHARLHLLHVSVAAVALAHSLNANMLRKWVIDAEHKGPAVKPAPIVAEEAPLPGPSFVPLAFKADP